uniref:Uncharacterized protein n=1 Tax=Arundo donax TaxID=35708 RepID=A0A0A8Y4W5_ARUDO
MVGVCKISLFGMKYNIVQSSDETFAEE